MFDTENMQIISRLFAITLDRWCSHRAAEKEQSIAFAPSEVLPPLCELATNGLHYIVFYRLKPLKRARYHSICIYGPRSRNFRTSA